MKSGLRVLLILTLFFLASQIKAEQLQDVTYMNMEIKRMPYQRDALFPTTRKWDYELSLNFKWQKGRVFFESDLTGQTYDSRFRNMWWDYTLGIDIVPQVSVVWDHRSQHALDKFVDKFPVRDSYGIRWNMIK